jgi:hypothetical protein
MKVRKPEQWYHHCGPRGVGWAGVQQFLNGGFSTSSSRQGSEVPRGAELLDFQDATQDSRGEIGKGVKSWEEQSSPGAPPASSLLSQ